MKLLTVNYGSASLKVRLFAAGPEALDGLARAAASGIGGTATLRARRADAPEEERRLELADHTAALQAVVSMLSIDAGDIAAVGHRVVHGGAHGEPAMIDGSVLEAIGAASRIAPLHNMPALRGIEAAGELFPGVPMVAVFDTQFHNTIPEVASSYALPRDLARRHGVRRTGYHGLAHQSLLKGVARACGRPADELNVITLQLGSGCSATAIANGVSVDTSMGFTPIEGLVMGTRAGDVDAGALTFLARAEGLSPDELDDLLTRRSGLLGVSGSSSNMRDLLDAESRGDAGAGLAVELFCYRVRKYIGAYIAVLGRVDAVVFGGGIGEREPDVRRRIVEPLRPLGLRLDRARNDSARDAATEISERGSPIAAWVVPTDEEQIIARETYSVVQSAATPR